MTAQALPRFNPAANGVPTWALVVFMLPVVLMGMGLAISVHPSSKLPAAPFMVLGLTALLATLSLSVFSLLRIERRKKAFLSSLTAYQLVSMLGRDGDTGVETGAALAVLEDKYPGWQVRCCEGL